MKYRIYIDEVGNSDLKSSTNPDHRFLCLAGVIFDLEYVRDVFQPDIEALKTKYFRSHPDEPVIFHRKELVYRKNAFTVLKEPLIEKAFNDEFLSLIEKWEFKVIAVVLAHTMRRYAFQEIFGIYDEKTTFSDEILKVLKNNKIFNYKEKLVGYGIMKLP